MRSNTKHFELMRGWLDTMPLIDCHDHSSCCGPAYSDAIDVVVGGYFSHDLISASSEEQVAIIQDSSLSLEERWPVLEKVWRRTCHTGYVQVTKRVLKRFYDEDKLSLAALKRMEDKLVDQTDPFIYEEILEQANIRLRLENIEYDHRYEPVNNLTAKGIKGVLEGTLVLPPRGRLVIPLPAFHSILDHASVWNIASTVGTTVTSLEEYLHVCRQIFEGYKQFGAVAFKDQCAYDRSLDYGNPTRAQAEELFNWFMSDPRRTLSYPEQAKLLNDYLFNEFMRMARDLDLPVQIHTGHMAGVRNDIVKANAIGLTRLMELHRDVRFDLFHANWPYSADILYLAKAYPNVTVDFCWANIIDPIYCQNLFKQLLSSVPHAKVHAYGSDFSGQVDRAWAHAEMARDNIAIALSEMVKMEYLDFDEAKEVAYAWLFGNANEFFKLGVKGKKL